jgi:hypothetical protein
MGVGRLRASRHVLWAALLAVIVATLAFHDAWRAIEPPFSGHALGHARGDRFPSFQVTFFSGEFVFMGYVLVLAGETARRWCAPYETYFEFGWRVALQIWFSSMFVAILYLVLWIGATLFMLVKLSFFQELLKQSWFYIPVSALAFAVGLHITEVRSDFIRGTRAILLTLMSWLLPPLVLIVAGFLASLPFTGLKPLWATRAAAGLLLCIAALMILLINAVFKSGGEIESTPRILRLSVCAACFMLPFLAVFASFAVWLRIEQYGLTPRRVLACASAFIACTYASGYMWAAMDHRRTLRRMAPVNVLLAWVSLAVLFAVFTPLADPARVAVNNQVSRLLSGRVAPERFDFRFLRFHSAAYGQRALARLETLSEGADAAVIREKSAQAARSTGFGTPIVTALNAESLSRNIVPRMPGRELPSSFIVNDWQRATSQQWQLPVCLKVTSVQCDAYLADLTGEGKPNVVLIPQSGGVASVFGQNSAGQWQLLGKFNIGPDCASIRDALSRGSYRLLEPRLHDLQINGERLQVETTMAHVATCHL